MSIEKHLSDGIFDSYSEIRDDTRKRQRYYDGFQDILYNSIYPEKKIEKRTRVVTNFIKYIVDQYVGFMITNPIQYLDNGFNVFNFPDIIIDNNIQAIDAEHLKDSILKGYSVELHSFEDGKIVIRQYDASDWALSYDESGLLRTAVYACSIPMYSYYNDVLLTEDLNIMVVYTDSDITYYENDEFIRTEDHFYGIVPVVVFKVNKDMEPFISDAIIGQQDLYNEIDASNADGVKYDVDSLLALVGADWSLYGDEDENGVTGIQKIRENRLVHLRDEGTAFFIERKVSKDSIEYIQNKIKDHIMMMGCAVDIDDIVGATGNTSGIALKLKFMPLHQKAGGFKKYFEESLEARIDLINIILSRLGMEELFGYKIVWLFNIPESIGDFVRAVDITEVMSRKDILSLINNVDDPESAAKRWREEYNSIKFNTGSGSSLNVIGSNENVINS